MPRGRRRRALDDALADEGNRREPSVQIELAESLISDGQLVRARELAAEALQQCRSSGRRMAEASALNVIGRVFLLDGDPEESSGRHLEALAIAETGSYVSVRVDAMIGLATAARRMGDTTAAESYAYQAMQIAATHEYEVHRCRALLVLAGLAEDDRRPADARRFGRLASESRGRIGYQPLLALAS